MENDICAFFKREKKKENFFIKKAHTKLGKIKKKIIKHLNDILKYQNYPYNNFQI